MELFEDEKPKDNAPEFSVSELSGAVKRMVEGEFAHVRVRGELGRISRPSSGHIYLDLKDDRSVLAAVVWKGQAARLSARPEEGLEVIATGRLTTFPGQSKYQMIIEDIAPAGAGALMARLEKLKAQLGEEGLFDPARKKPIPFLPEVIGVITSPSGAVIRDILHRLRDRFPRKVIVWPVAVQGQAAAGEVARAIAGFNALTPGGAMPRPDLLIVARGGGSVEDLWAFNEEVVVRAAAASDIPLISAVGHETDTTLIDYAADRRAPTPTAAAEMAVPVRMDLFAQMQSLEARQSRAMQQVLTRRGQRLSDLSRALPRADALLAGQAQRLDFAAQRLDAALQTGIDARALRLARNALTPSVLRTRINNDLRTIDVLATRASAATERLMRQKEQAVENIDRLRETLGYAATLKRGFAVVRADGHVATSTAALEAATSVEVELTDGRVRIR
ncbi:exodeoxyribonuclease VII large subunit [Ketogulonicigenium vulgare]|uniref:Exodeoxyribonuclease 7 large subunit n=1 Tax=Ketogulonicigenium vulgare (strain WSH-001) TaxID=759362 RepID=F9Y9G2_KETVW|nr:exodeoxyribonuclease VII large subunit [Ketogulonicigenium vulgare]ADO41919.1 exodeoxyribonuclease VII, large subunit [Ketogulonicigenium vulgare Y25]AEM40144.1 Exodeoxyribonuclease 7 large subunit [Ketogulonicigenium vulgare WSH-001]ALJ80349.1 exodeoxyribonuclease VII large subunit [Ketogulonicigenium vulgare]ANW33184.1 exodeoxyribonuclease VII large subunit [Ketogulonicigenium vulgare]AOZ53843.1 exodeoxyribonuclease VII, large subunit [Ketogulonicigenium vulgare]